VTLAGLPGPPITNPFGEYIVLVPPNWSGTVVPTLAGYSFDPPSRTYHDVTSSMAGQDYTALIIGSFQISTSSIPSGIRNFAYGAMLYAINGVSPYSWSVISGRLPNGLTLGTNGQITGTPTEAGDFSFTVRVSDSGSPQQFATRYFGLNISPAHQGFWTTTYPYGGRINPLGLVISRGEGVTIYVAPEWRGVYKSEDGGSSWQNITDYLQTPFDKSDMRIFLVRSASEFYTAGHSGIFRSTDAGQNWRQIGSSISGLVTALTLHPTDGDILYAGTENGGIFKLADKGLSWTSISSGFPSNEVRTIAVDPANTSIVYAGTKSNGIYRSINGGAWESANGTGNLRRVEDIAFAPTNPPTIYIAGNDTNLGDGIFKTTDAGSTWTKQLNVGVSWRPGYYIAIGPSNTIYVVSSSFVYKSTDGGSTWTNYAVTESTINCLAIDPNNPATLYVGTEGHGVFKSTNGGQTWTEINNGIRAMNFPHSESHSIHVDRNNPNYIYAGSINNGYRSINRGQTWEKMNHPEWEISSILTHSARPGEVFTLRNRFWKSANYESSGTWSDPTGGSFCCVQDGDLGIAYDNPLILYAGVTGSAGLADGVYKSIDGGLSWTLKKNGLTNPAIDTLTIHPTNSNTIFVSTQAERPPEPGKNTRLFRTIDGGDNWEHITCGLPDFLNINQIVFYPDNPNIIYMGAEVENGGVYKSDNGGDCWYKVLNENVNAVAVHPNNANIVYAGTWNSGGFYISLNGGQTWTQLNNGLPLSPGIESMALDPINPYHVFIGTTAGVYEATFSIDFTITTVSLPTGIMNEAYSATLKAMGGTPPYTWEIVSGSLPNGVGLDQNTGEITGITTTPGSFNFTIKATEKGGQTFTKNMNITVFNTYVLNVIANPSVGGSVSKNPDKPKYIDGEMVNVSVTTNAGYVFTGWSGDATGRSSLGHVQMTRNKNITANFALIADLPDYSVQSSTLPGAANAGDIIRDSVSVTVKNQGANDPYTSDIFVGIYLSSDPVITTSDILLWKGRSSIKALTSGSTTGVAINPNLQIPTTVSAGSYYYIGVLVDESDVIVEGDESNNSATQAIDISTTGDGTFETVGMWPGGSSYGLAVDEARKLMFVGNGPLFQVVDISDPAHPRKKSELYLSSSLVNVIVLRGNYAYCADGAEGLVIVDTSDPNHPTRVGTCSTMQSIARGVDISGDYAYVADYHYGLRVIDISVPSNPHEVAFLPLPDLTREVKIFENYAYVTNRVHLGRAGTPALRIIDITQPTDPKIMCTYEFQYEVYIPAIDSSSRYLYVPTAGGGLRVLDVSDKTAPFEVAHYEGALSPSKVIIKGNYAYLDDNTQYKVVILDISDVHNITEVSSYRFNKQLPFYGFEVGGNLWIVNAWYDSLRILDISNLNALVEVGSYDIVGLLNYADVANGHAYVANSTATRNRLKVLDMSSLPGITETATFDSPYAIYDVVTSGNHAYLPAYNRGLRVIDISNPSTLFEAGAYEGLQQARDVVVSGKYAYVADGTYGLRIFDISTPSNPVLVSTCRSRGNITQVALSGNYVYLAARAAGLRIIDVSDPLNPWEVGFYQFNGSAFNVNVAGGYAYVNDNYLLLRIVDVSNPKNPFEVSTFNLYYTYGDIGISGHFLIVPDWLYGVRIINVSNPASPTEVDVLREFFTSEEIFVRENFIYVVNRDTGFYVLKFRLLSP
jgi:uncharacterized repeat protein (TIGR02543 family)